MNQVGPRGENIHILSGQGFFTQIYHDLLNLRPDNLVQCHCLSFTKSHTGCNKSQIWQSGETTLTDFCSSPANGAIISAK